jgi:hypothetical protein
MSCKTSTIVISFPEEMELGAGTQSELHDVVAHLCCEWERKNPGKVMWPFQVGFPDHESTAGQYHITVASRDDIHRTRPADSSPKKPVFVLRYDGKHAAHDDKNTAQEDMASLLDTMIPGQTATVRCVEMSEQELNAMPDFEGW